MSSDDTTGFGPDFPANDVERALGRAIDRGTGASADALGDDPAGAFFAELRASQVWVPVPEGSGRQDDGAISLPSLELEGAMYVPVFTSQEQYDRRSAQVPHAVLNITDLAEVLPEGVGLAVNPGNEASVPIGPDAVPSLIRR